MTPLPPDSTYRRLFEWQLMEGAVKRQRPSCLNASERDTGPLAAACGREMTVAVPAPPHGPRRLLHRLRAFILQVQAA
jgi:hypothetical protein